MQIAPMIDITLLLLFFFMLSGKITKGDKLMQIALPGAAVARPTDQEGDRDVVNIDANGQLFSGDRPMTERELTAHLKQRFKDMPPLKLYVRADAGASGKRIRDVMKIAARAGAIEVIFGALQK